MGADDKLAAALHPLSEMGRGAANTVLDTADRVHARTADLERLTAEVRGILVGGIASSPRRGSHYKALRHALNAIDAHDAGPKVG